MKAISEFTQTVFNPSGDEWLLANQPVSGGGYISCKVKLSTLGNFIRNATPQEPDVPEVPKITINNVTLTDANNSYANLTVKGINPNDSTLKYAVSTTTTIPTSWTSCTTSNGTSSKIKITFTAKTNNQQKYVFFQLTKDGYEDAIYRMKIKQAFSQTTNTTTTYQYGSSEHGWGKNNYSAYLSQWRSDHPNYTITWSGWTTSGAYRIEYKYPVTTTNTVSTYSHSIVEQVAKI